MKRIFLTLVVTLIATSSSLSAHIKRIDAPDRYGYNEELPLYGDVLSMTITDVSTTYVTCKEYRFNAAGDVVECEQTGGGWSMKSTYEYKYDSSGKMLEVSEYDSQGELVDKRVFDHTANDSGVSASTALNSDSTYKYDSAGNVVEEIICDESGIMISRYTCKYDARGNLIERAKFDSHGALVETSTYEYDSHDNMIEMYVRYGGDQSLVQSVTSEITYRT